MPIINPVSTGTVVSVNNTLPDQDGNVDLSTLTTYEVTVLVADWSSNLVTISMPSITVNTVIWLGPDEASYNDFQTAKIVGISQAAGTITLQCITTPTTDISIIFILVEPGVI